VVVIGASAGGIQALCRILESLPPHFGAPLLAVIHTGEGPSVLDEVLQRCGGVKVVRAVKSHKLREGHLYIGTPNRHLIVQDGSVSSVMGPRENRQRPAVDALFRSAARAHRSEVIAVVLSGYLDDGSAGALAVKARGGTVIVQDPREAEAPMMPQNVVQQVGADFCLPLAEIPSTLTRLIEQSKSKKEKPRKLNSRTNGSKTKSTKTEMEPPALSCPECGGALLELKDGKVVQYRCHVGHTYSQDTFTEAHSEALERALWVALRKLNEQKSFSQQLAARSTNGEGRQRFEEHAVTAEHDMQLLHEILGRL